MHIITQSRLREFARHHPTTKTPLRAWETMIRAKKYRTPHEIRTDFFGSADFLGDGRTVFNIGGTKYRIVAKILYRSGQVLIRHVLTHKEYDRLTRLGTL